MVSPAERRYTLLAVALGSSLAPFMVAGLFVAIPAVGEEFTADPVVLSWIPTVFFLAAAMFLIPFGRIADIYGGKRVFSIGLAIYFISALISALAPTAPVLIGARFLTGVGAAMIFATSFALLGLILPDSERGTALGVNIAASFGGFALGFLAGGLLAYYGTWRVLFLVPLPVALLAVGIIRRYLRGECALSRGTRPDLPGIALSTTTILLLMVGLSLLPAVQGAAALVAGLAALGAFIVHEARTEDPVLDIHLLLRNRPLALANAAVLAYSAAASAYVYLFSLYFQYVQGFDARLAGSLFLVASLVTASLVGYAGRLSDRGSPHLVATAGVAMTIAGLATLSFIDPAMPVAVPVFALALIVVGIAFFQPPVYNIVIGAAERAMYGVASGLVETMRLLGMTASMAVTIVAFALFFKGMAITGETVPLLLGSMQTLFRIYLALAVVSLVMTWLTGRAGRSAP
ncbi:MFS transporter [Methanoculleus oceani]|uniref:MFS transporter n=1 Tax=Methanoculleus oceani TaxID=2184756 RepID=A0ABD4TB68_9EURY|nr:MFS transporter [Methanoculleus sp. CWC-02]MCM2464993.1 MFS transporter [Methanoculleus sp. CWC-02]